MAKQNKKTSGHLQVLHPEKSVYLISSRSGQLELGRVLPTESQGKLF
jgi:hypothetical protein